MPGRILLLIFLVTPPIPAQDPLAGLWLADLGPRHATLVLWADADDLPALHCGVRGGPPRAVHLESRGRFRVAQIAGLQPERVYEASCGWRRTSFVTPAARPERVRVAVVGHTGGTQSARRSAPERMVARVADLAPDLVLHAGDAVYNCTEQQFHRAFYRHFDRVLRHVPVYLAPGNHEAGWPDRKVSYEVFRRALPYPLAKASQPAGRPPFYALRRGPVLFLVLSYYRDALRPDSPQRQWLARTLAGSDARFNVLVLGLDRETFAGRDAFLKSLPRNKVDLVIGGDGKGCYLKREQGHRVLFNGDDGGSRPAVTLLEVHPTRMVLNMHRPGTGNRKSMVIRFSRELPGICDLSPAFQGGLLRGAHLLPRPDGAPTIAGFGTAVLWTTRALQYPLRPGRRARGLQVEVSATKAPSLQKTPEAILYLFHHPQGHASPGLLHRTQPEAFKADGRRVLLTVPFPAVDPIDGKPHPVVDGVGLEVVDGKGRLGSLTIHRAWLY